ncbi:hypothetical protein [Saccharothrix stipae]
MSDGYPQKCGKPGKFFAFRDVFGRVREDCAEMARGLRGRAVAGVAQ